MSKAYIACQVLPGLFDNEYYVLVNGSSAYYVHRSNVQVTGIPQGDKPLDGTVLGYVIETMQDKTLVQLPGEAVIGGLRTWVESGAVSSVA